MTRELELWCRASDALRPPPAEAFSAWIERVVRLPQGLSAAPGKVTNAEFLARPPQRPLATALRFGLFLRLVGKNRPVGKKLVQELLGAAQFSAPLPRGLGGFGQGLVGRFVHRSAVPCDLRRDDIEGDDGRRDLER
jgi:hypothetical protein